MREGVKKPLRKKNIEHILAKLMGAIKYKKTLDTFLKKVDEDDDIKKLLIYFKQSYEGDEKKTSKNNIAGQMLFLFPGMYLFLSECFFILY